MDELIFVVEKAPEGGCTARALGESIFTEADDLAQLQDQVCDAVLCHFDDEKARPKVVRLHFVREAGAALIGCVSGEPSDLSEETGKKFRQLLTRQQDPR